MGWKRLPSKHLVQGQTRLLRAVSQSGSESSQRRRWHLGSLFQHSTNLQGKAISLYQAEHLVSAVPFAFHSLSMQSQVPSSTMLPVHICPERTHSHVCTCTATQHTAIHTLEDFIYKFMAWNIVLSNSVSLKPNSGTVLCNRKEKDRWFSTEISSEIMYKICAKLWFTMGQEMTLYKEENYCQILA